jgi:hypothetical protein
MIRVFHSGSGLFTHPGSRIRDPGVKMAPDPESRIRIRNTGYDIGVTNHIWVSASPVIFNLVSWSKYCFSHSLYT